MKEIQFRNKINWFTFFFSILVIWVHSYNSELFLGKSDTADMVYLLEHFLGETVAQIAVPGFFMISAYLFYRNFTWNKLISKWMARIKSVLIPFIVWNSLYYVGYLVTSRLPVITDVVGRGSVPVSLKITVDAILNYTYNPVFWYLYQLILLILAAPVIYAVLKHKYIGILYLILVLFGAGMGGRLYYLNLDALFYYSVAAFAALHLKKQVEQEDRNRYLLGSMLIAAGILCHVLFRIHGLVLFTVLYRLLIPAALWVIVRDSWLPSSRSWMCNNFFLYAIHFGIVRFVNKAGALLLPGIPAVPLLLYLFMPVIAVWCSFLLAEFLKRYAEPLWNLLNGSRD